MQSFNLISFLSSVVSLVLGVVAIWLSLYHKKEAEITNEKVRDLLLKVQTDAQVVTQYALPELSMVNKAMVDHVFKKNSLEAGVLSASKAGDGSSHVNIGTVQEFSMIVEEISEGKGYTRQQRDKAVRLARKIKEEGKSKEIDFISSLESLIDAFAASGQSQFIDFLDDLFPEITTNEQGINQTMLLSLGLRLTETDIPSDDVVARFTKHYNASERLDSIEHGIPALLVYYNEQGKSDEIVNLSEKIKKLDEIKIASIQQAMDRRTDPYEIARNPTQKVKEVAAKYRNFQVKYPLFFS